MAWLLFLLVIFFNIFTLSISCPDDQKQNLLQFKSAFLNNITSTNNSSSSSFSISRLESWNSTSDCCLWKRVGCDSKLGSRAVVNLNLSSLLISENLDLVVSARALTPLFRIHTLMMLDLYNNSIQGEIPGDDLANLSKLVHLNLKRNHFVGRIPSQIFRLRYLKYLNLNDNSLSGDLSHEIGYLQNLRTLALGNNSLDGNIPEEIGNLTKLQGLNLVQNDFSGSIPLSLLNLTHLESLQLGNNVLTSQIPEDIGSLSKLYWLNLAANKLTGAIPQSVQNLSKLEVLFLHDNLLSGEIPSRLFDLKALKMLYLGGNTLTWNNNSKIEPKSMQLSNMIKLEILDLQDNKITGEFPEFITEISTLRIINMRNSSMQGPLPKSISKLASLQILDLSSNNLSGSIPEELVNLFRINKRPGIFSTLTSSLYAFNVTTVNWKRSLQDLSSASIESYCLLDLSNNRFSGEIPSSLGHIKDLKTMNLSHNWLSGRIPFSFGGLKNLESLDLSHNNLSGPIPKSFENLQQLNTLDVSNNHLEGRIPRSGQMDTMNDPNYFINNNGLCGFQIRVPCPDEISPPPATTENEIKLSNYMWKEGRTGFLVGFFSSMLNIVVITIWSHRC